MTFNIHHGKGIDNQVDLQRIAQVIKDSDADIIGLNEVDKHFSKRSHYKNQIGWLAKQLNFEHTFSPSLSLKSKNSGNFMRQYGNALLSRYPIVTKKSHSFNYITGLVEGRSLLDATIQINEQLYQIMVTHLSLSPYLHRKQTEYILNQLHKYPHPTIIMGDWNMKPGSRQWRKLTEKVQDTWQTVGIGTGQTYPSIRPRARLDYIFVSPELQAVKAEVIIKSAKASDHLPLKVTITCHK
ncbi:endonuclease/exonuclease/phosphatase family protein [Metabacillus sp. BG109]|uniref:Endonuclease/exonuclease/phosphatase family protein n=2 Tax=Metabacillus bambusae TaxID=2795218 RepID=A0ABS3MZI8_9BACI|nr:endonuclease/exonuclease/phosphatase family protein [Metabacillus bambusae]